MPRPQIIIIEGNIGSGKSTLARRLGEALEAKIFIEPVKANPYLSAFYADPVKHAFTMQIWLLRQRYRTYIAALRHILETGQSVILDRSVYSDNVFGYNSYVSNQISGIGYAYYLHLREKLLSSLVVPTVTLYLDASPEVCQNRILNLRKRECESSIPLEYLAGLDKAYRSFLGEMRQRGSMVYEVPYDTFCDPTEIINVVCQLPKIEMPSGDAKRALLDSMKEENLRAVMLVDVEKEMAEIEKIVLPPRGNNIVRFERDQVRSLLDDCDCLVDYPIPVIDFGKVGSAGVFVYGEAEDCVEV